MPELSNGLEACLRTGDTRGAAALAGRLEGSPPGLRDAFLGLLSRRGYFVASSVDLRRSLEEIRTVGPGFDLYDLAEAVAAGHVADRAIPELLQVFPPGGAG